MDSAKTRLGRRTVPLGEAQRQQLELDAAWGAIVALPAVVPLEFSPGLKTLRQYELLQELGKGEFAEVQACRRVADGGPASPVFAIKHISKARIVLTSNMKRTLRQIKYVGTELAAMRILSSTCVRRQEWDDTVVPAVAEVARTAVALAPHPLAVVDLFAAVAPATTLI